MTMKKNSLFIFLIIAVFLMPAVACAVEKDVADTKSEAVAKTEIPKSAAVAEVRDADRDSLKAGKPVPVATVLDDEKKKSTGSVSKTETVRTKGAATKASSAAIPEKKSSESPKKKEASSALNTAEMQRRWKALFSKETAPDSIVYTVQSGDSLYVLAQKNHTTVDFIKKINDLKSDNIYPKMKLKIHTAPFSIQIDKSKNVLVLYSNDEAVKKYSVATGKKNSTPVGEFKITDKLVNPTWFKTGAILPPGSPENALGTRWMGFDKPAYGIHGTIHPETIGSQASEGCVRMLNEEVEELYSIVPVGTKVTIQD
jgi:lipoprotein-anchoring transpeptidase ErfK/SrfK